MRPSRVASILAALVLLSAGAAPARVIETPSFPIGPPDGYAVVRGVAVGLDGTVVFAYADSAGQILTRWTSAAGMALAPALRITSPVGPARHVSDGNGGSIVAFTRFIVAENAAHLFARRLDGMGVPVGVEFQVDAASGDVAPFSFDLAGLPGGSVFAWYQAGQVRVRLFDGAGVPRGPAFGIDDSTAAFFAAVAARSDGGFAVTWVTNAEPFYGGRVATFTADGSMRSAVVDLPVLLQRAAIAGGPDGGFAVTGIANQSGSRDLVLRRYDADAHALGETAVAPIAEEADARSTIAADAGGNWHVVWGASRKEPGTGTFLGFDSPLARPIAADGTPLEPAFVLSPLRTTVVSTARLPSGSFVNAWVALASEPDQTRSWGNVVSLCTPDIRSCGDGVLDGRCEECDAGAGNSDDTPDVCRTTCELPRCGDGTADAGEACDDGNLVRCDGCSDACQLEVGLACGDGIVVPGCVERCDDGNTVHGDGCTPACTLERVPGGGSRSTDCLAEWVVDNPTNAPRFDSRGGYSAKHRCVDGDPRCDFDGGVAGRCTFRVRVCGNNTDVLGCSPPSRLSGWQLTRPSTKQIAKNPALGVVRDAFGVVAGATVGPLTADVCSEFVDVVVPLRGTPSRWRPAKLALKATATAYDGRADTDVLALTCLPPS